MILRGAVGRIEKAGMLLCRLRHGLHNAVPVIAVPLQKSGTVILESYGFHDGSPDVGIIGVGMRTLEIAEHRPVIGMIALVAHMLALLLRRHRPKAAYLFRRGAALQHVEAELVPVERPCGILER